MRKGYDRFSKEAKAKGYVARSAFKLGELQRRYRLIPSGGVVLDLGCSPGAWLQVACQALGRGGFIYGLDLQDCKLPLRYCDARVHTSTSDVCSLSAQHLRSVVQACGHSSFTTVLSDMCHSTLGIASADAARSLHLARHAARLALSEADASSGLESEGWGQGGALKPGGNFCCKILQGEGSREFHAQLKPHFQMLKWAQPEASRSESREMYLVGLHRHASACASLG